MTIKSYRAYLFFCSIIFLSCTISRASDWEGIPTKKSDVSITGDTATTSSFHAGPVETITLSNVKHFTHVDPIYLERRDPGKTPGTIIHKKLSGLLIKFTADCLFAVNCKFDDAKRSYKFLTIQDFPRGLILTNPDEVDAALCISEIALPSNWHLVHSIKVVKDILGRPMLEYFYQAHDKKTIYLAPTIAERVEAMLYENGGRRIEINLIGLEKDRQPYVDLCHVVRVKTE